MSGFITAICALAAAFVAGLYAIEQVRVNNITKHKLEQLSNLRKYLASFLLRSNSSDIAHIDEVKQNLYSIIANLDASSQNEELYDLIIEYLKYLKNNSYNEDKVLEISNKARALFSNQWNDILNLK